MVTLQESMCGSKHSSTSSTCRSPCALSRENSFSSLPDTECEWPELESPGRTSTPQMIIQQLPTGVAGPPGRFFAAGKATPEPTLTFYQVAYQGGLEVRAGPFDAPLTDIVLPHKQTFAVTQEVAGTDGRVYLCLADGRGWVFDDSKLLPHDPSVVRRFYTAPQAPLTLPPPFPVQPSTIIQGWPEEPDAEVRSTSPLVYASVPPPPPSPCEPSSSLPPPPPPPPPCTTPVLVSSTPCSPVAAGLQSPTTTVAGAPPVSWFRVSHPCGLGLRCAPSMSAPLTGINLAPNETFPVAEEVPSSDGRTYLRLSDGRGWVWDDTALSPHFPCVKRGNWTALQSSGPMQMLTTGLPEGQTSAFPNQRRRMYTQPRGKRGGKRAKRKQLALGGMASMA